MTQPTNNPKFCSTCGAVIQDSAKFCSQCAQPINYEAAQISSEHSSSLTIPEKRVGILLGLGILFIPYIFSWFTLGKGYSIKDKVISFLWMIIVIFIVWGPSSKQTNTPSMSGASLSNNSQPEIDPKELALKSVKLDFKWNTGGFGNVMKADFTIQNPTIHTIKDIEITCIHYANSGTKIDSNERTVYEIVPANGKKVVTDFNMGFIHNQASSSSCQVTDLRIVK
jgi:uncharacterized membrane protein YvbJ